MKLMTSEIRRKLLPAPLYVNESVDEPVAIVKFFDPCGRGTWYATEFDGEDTFYGFVVSPLGADCDEWGYFSLAELSSVKNRFGLGIERDNGFKPTKLRKDGSLIKEES